MAKLVIVGAFLIITQNFVCFFYFLEFLICVRFFINIRMILF
ncbi:Uncharacterised protein [Mycobacteroides abscessus subsp. abscessus]|nr:Uncharacterised protein [Mycobacteroides abscessus subsp. abscessus]